MVRTISLLALFSVLSAVACAGPAGDATVAGGSAAATEGEHHRAAMTACDEAVNATLARKGPIDEQMQAESDYRACLARANDAAIAPIASASMKHQPTTANALEQTIVALRSANATLCAELAKASDEQGTDVGRITSAICPANRELFIAAAIEGMVKLDGNGLAPIQAWPEQHEDCYVAHPPTSAEAKTALEACVRRDMDVFLPELADGIHESDPSTSVDAAKDDVTGAIDRALRAGDALCDALGGAGDGDANLCGVRLAEDIYVIARPEQ